MDIQVVRITSKGHDLTGLTYSVTNVDLHTVLNFTTEPEQILGTYINRVASHQDWLPDPTDSH